MPRVQGGRGATGATSGMVEIVRSLGRIPAVSNRNAFFIGAALLLAGLWSMRSLARRR
jgi:hypothetical protein